MSAKLPHFLVYHCLKYDTGIQKAWLCDKDHLELTSEVFAKLSLLKLIKLTLLIKAIMNATNDDSNKEPFGK